jgi:SAM-dependent methyltransferase
MAKNKISKKRRSPGPSLFPDWEAERRGEPATAQTYDPLPSVWEGSDAELLEKMLAFYPHTPPTKILDATVNAGRFWEGSKRKVVGLDIDPGVKPDIVADNTNMPFADEAFEVVVYDPPHVPNQGKDREKDFNTRFGLVIKSSAKQGYNFSHMYPPFCKEAYRVLKHDGVLFCKIADYVHGHRFQWAHVEMINAAVAVGFTACDCIVKVRKGPITDPKWKKAHHARRQHCYWIVFRKSTKCE